MSARFWAKVRQDESGCWLWVGSVQSSGYGCWSLRGKRVLAHRFAWSHLRGEIPASLTIDHLCQTRRCVNPWHMEPVPASVNGQRGWLADRCLLPGGLTQHRSASYYELRDRARAAESRLCMAAVFADLLARLEVAATT